jgi:thiol-disulfide isomerase/thioredoxin
MKKTTLFLLLLTFGFSLNAQVQNYSLGDVVDDFTVTDTDGVEHNLYSITAQGKYVYLDFFFTACVPCQNNQPAFSEFHDKYGCNEGEVYCLSINNGNDNNAAVIAYEEQYGGYYESAPAVSNEGGGPAVDANFGILAYPTFCLINPDNEIIELDIWNGSVSVELFESTFPAGFNPPINYCTPLGIEDNTLGASFKMFPNPSNGGAVSITLDSSINNAQVLIYTVEGKLVYANNFESSNIELNPELASGMYMVTINFEQSSATKSLLVK